MDPQASMRNMKNFRRAVAATRDTLSSRRRAYRNGNRALQNGQLELAENLVNQAVVGSDAPVAWIQRLGFIQERAGKYSEALKNYHRAIHGDPGQAEWYYRAGICAKNLGQFEQATELFESAVTRGERHTRAAKALIENLPANTPAWRRIDLYERALAVTEDLATLRGAATLNYNMKRYAASLVLVEKIESTDTASEADLILKSMCLLDLGESSKAFAQLKRLSGGSRNAKARKIGPGYYLDQKHDWENAFTVHSLEWTDSGSTNAEAAFGAAYALDRLYKWSESLGWYRRAIARPNGDRAYWAYKYAHALERCEQFELASSWYQRALDLGKMRQSDWFYRLGYCQFALNELDSSFHSLRNYLLGDDASGRSVGETDSERPAAFYDSTSEYKESVKRVSAKTRNQLLASTAGLRSAAERSLAKARLLAAEGSFQKASLRYRLYLCHSSNPDRNILLEVAENYYRAGEKQAACEVLLDSREFQRPDGIDQKRYLKTDFERRVTRYAEYTERFHVNDKIVLFESYWGSRVADSPLAIYTAMRNDSRFADREFYWTVQSNCPIPDQLVDDGRTFLVEYGSRKYDRILATAGVLVNNTSWVRYFSRRPEQRYVNTWHGTPMKTLGKNIGTGVLEHANVARNFLNVTDFILPNDFTAEKILKDYDLAGLTQANFSPVGSPRLDDVVLGGRTKRSAILSKLGIDVATTKSVVLYAPTWRGSATDKSMNVDIAEDALDALSDIEDCIVLFRAHHLAQSSLVSTDINTIVVPDEIDTYDLLDAVDILVSDYSSLLIDFLSTSRPIVCFVPDLDAYSEERGLYFEPSDLTDLVAGNSKSLRTLVSQIHDEVSTTQTAAADRFCALEDGHAADRVLDRILADPRINSVSSRGTLVFFESMIPNGIRSSFINLSKLVNREDYELKVAVDVKQVEADSNRQDGLAELPDDMGVIGRLGEMVMTLEERYALTEFSRRFGDTSQPLEQLVDGAYRREFRRVFGYPQNVMFIDFEGYSRYWNALIGRGLPSGNFNGVVLHNEMDKERERRFPYMAEVIRNYARYGSVASVSSSINDDNVKAAVALGVEFRNRPGVVHNSIDSESILRKSLKDQNLWESFPAASPKIISIGRLSPEKNQSLLIESIPHVRNVYPNAELIVIGSGPSAPTLRTRVRDMGLEDCVHFVGFQSNPMSTLAQSDVFVLTSVHEGQPMVIFEAMSLSVPVVTTPVPGCVEACVAGDGLVVDYDPLEVANGIISTLARETVPSVFDPIAYNENALAEFDEFVEVALSSPVFAGNRTYNQAGSA
ncbi:CDP-glycerol glycerophosphotransferase [Brevibacterium aurantiacum]|uniref:CDP-glycerol glycerophosphotransferase n=2 Tax=Brevibacterium aurantiacum TaxID=273384 RepID=A0A2H1KXF8_BREAU|nr:CDP-glycerol glycerophosphotransferase [Brevibacterium aurantiacum]